MSRHKRLIGPKLRTRRAGAQASEAALAVQALNRMIRAAKPVTVRQT